MAETRDVEFPVHEGRLSGIVYVPEGGSPPCPAIVMSHGLRAPKEFGLPPVAEAFCEAGFVVLLYDNRHAVEHDSPVQFDMDPVQETRDMRWAITCASLLEEVDRERIGIWGTSMSGGTVLEVAAIDRRVKAVVSQVPVISGWEMMNHLVPPLHEVPGLRALLDEDRVNIFNGGEPGRIQMASDDPATPSAFPPGSRTYYYYHSLKDQAQNTWWKNEISLRSLDWLMEHDVTHWVPRIGPTPLLLITTEEDTSCSTELALNAFHSAREPKELFIASGDHYTAYFENLELVTNAARDFFLRRLVTGQPSQPFSSPA